MECNYSKSNLNANIILKIKFNYKNIIISNNYYKILIFEFFWSLFRTIILVRFSSKSKYENTCKFLCSIFENQTKLL